MTNKRMLAFNPKATSIIFATALCALLETYERESTAVEPQNTEHHEKGRNSQLRVTTPTGRTVNRTLAKIQSYEDRGRILLLVCLDNCGKERVEVSSLIREYNHNFNSSAREDEIGFHFHYRRQPFPFYGVEERLRDGRRIDLVYIIAAQLIPYPGDGNIDRSKLRNWLAELDAPPIAISSHRELSDWMDSGAGKEGCNGLSLLFVHDEQLCSLTTTLVVLNAALNGRRMERNAPQGGTAEVLKPMDRRLEVLMGWRLPHLSNRCQMIVMLSGTRFAELNSELHPSALLKLLLKAPTNCSSFYDLTSYDGYEIQATPSEIHLEFLSEEYSIRGLEHNQLYMMVGIIGGMAVVALAISIFWGLNGTSFVSKQR